jgi:hypothetical protein
MRTGDVLARRLLDRRCEFVLLMLPYFGAVVCVGGVPINSVNYQVLNDTLTALGEQLMCVTRSDRSHRLLHLERVRDDGL